MDKNQIIGFILIFALLLGYTYYSAPTEEELEKRRLEEEKVAMQAELPEQAEDVISIDQAAALPEVRDSLALLRNQAAFGTFATAATGTAEEVVIENGDIKLTFSTKGGKIVKAEVLNHKRLEEHEDRTKSTLPLYLMDNPKNKFEYILPVDNLTSGGVSTESLYFKPEVSGNRLTMSATTTTGGVIQQVYDLAEEGYKIDYDLVLNGMTGNISPGKDITLNWVNNLDKLELNETFEQRYSTIYFKESDDNNADYCSCASDDVESLTEDKVDWISHSNQFFNTSLVATGVPFSGAELITTMTDLDESEVLKKLESKVYIPVNADSDRFTMSMYVGPNEFERLRLYDNSLEQIIPFGNSIFGSINRWVIRPFFNFLSQFVGSKGLVIILLIFIIKMLLYPLMYKMLHSQALMGALKPKLSHLKEKYKDEPQKIQMETMKIYREHGVSPFGGCMPMILQMPIWYALFRFFPASITFRQESFLWAYDLSSYDDFFHLPFSIPFVGDHLSLFTILWAISTLVYTYYNTKHMDTSANPAMKYMQYLMPIMFLGFFNTYAAGLTCYMFFSNLINILQTVVTKKFVFSDDKLQAELDKKKAKPKKKSSFQERLEQAMKEQQKQQAKNKKK